MTFKRFLPTFAFFAVLISCVLSKPTNRNYEDLKNLGILNTTSDCFEIITGSRGRISYKLFEPLNPNERCVWIIQTPDAGEYDVYLDSLGTPSSLIISAFGLQNSNRTVVPTEPVDIFFTGQNILVITLYTGPEIPESGTGFSLIFIGVAAGTPISGNSTQKLTSADSGRFRLPDYRRNVYDNREISTFMVLPSSQYNVGFLKTEVVYLLEGLEGSGCNDRIDVYLFNTTLEIGDKWQNTDTICGISLTEVITNSDLILLVFRSDASNVNTGFQIFTHIHKC